MHDETALHRLVSELVALERQLLADPDSGIATSAAFAAKLGVDPGNWSRMKTGRQAPSQRLFDGALLAFPAAFFAYIQGSLREINETLDARVPCITGTCRAS